MFVDGQRESTLSQCSSMKGKKRFFGIKQRTVDALRVVNVVVSRGVKVADFTAILNDCLGQAFSWVAQVRNVHMRKC